MAKSFDSHDWENDAEWNRYLNNLYFPNDTMREHLIFKFKQRYYKDQIDPDYVVRDYKANASSSTSTTSSNTTNQRTSPSNNNNSNNNQQRSSSPPPTQQSQQQPQPAAAARASPQYSHFLYVSWVVAQLAIFLLTILFLFTNNPTYFYRAFLASIISYSIPLFQTYEGTFDRERLIDTALKNDNAHFLMLGLIMYFLGPPSLVLLMPNFTYSLFHLLGVLAPKVRNNAFIYKYVTLLQSKRQRAIEFAVQMEMWIMVFLIFSIFRGASPICVFAYYKFLKIRYATNQMSRMMFAEVGRKVDHFVNTTAWLPSLLRKIIIKVKAYVSQE
ncbi:transmembrane protein [Heterostelium album PN500]|uniref:Transmembrane protein n=1 Tax=Heterostelium pallidum (strain ATCC 26659 / Pp 5 / PN500) TaxID=670386 RepID=D3BHC8_HETP5|nr:transmembrane protein [Heterostelium album PN500]EFA79105.1 transmembrane protein [Heterostelium album PN500]|eukprot:XP_020431227.1 transmembrane protein [Heterostelium album PN500]